VLYYPEPDAVPFCGLCIPGKSGVGQDYGESGTQTPNYQFHFAILKTSRVPVRWLHNRALDHRRTTATLTEPKLGVLIRWSPAR